MKYRIKVIAIMAAVAAIIIALSDAEALANGVPTGQATLTGTVYCIEPDGTMHSKEGTCSADHLAHLLITDDGKVFILGGDTEVMEEIRKAPLKKGEKVKIRGEVSPEHKSIKVKWWEEYETIGD